MEETFEIREVRFLNKSVMGGSAASESDDERTPILRDHNENKDKHDEKQDSGSEAINTNAAPARVNTLTVSWNQIQPQIAAKTTCT